METYALVLAVLGVAVLGAAVLPSLLDRLPVSLPIVYVVAGMLLFSLPVDIDAPQPTDGDDTTWAEHLTELVVIVSLMGAGLKLRRPVGWRSWSSTWRLLGITMPITIGAIALLGGAFLGLPLAAAILLGAVLAPTDPVLASDVQLTGPRADRDADRDVDQPEPTEPGTADEADAEDEARFALTSEAGLNDGLAFPFTNLAIALAAGGAWFGGWLLDDVVLKLTIGLVSGLVLGRLVGYLAFGIPATVQLARTGQGFVSIGATFLVYGVTELLHGYGFLAVFVAAVVIRQTELDHEYHEVLHDFAETLERLASVVFLLLLGGSVVDGALVALSPAGVVVAVAVVLLVRPVAGLLGLLGSGLPRAQRWPIAFFGIRGMGTIYYLAHAVTEERFPSSLEVWSVAIVAILASVVLHGVTVSHVFRR